MTKPIWKSYVWFNDKCFLVSTIERPFYTYEGTFQGYETLVWEYHYQKKKLGNLIYQAGGLNDHQNICRNLIAFGKEKINEYVHEEQEGQGKDF